MVGEDEDWQNAEIPESSASSSESSSESSEAEQSTETGSMTEPSARYRYWKFFTFESFLKLIAVCEHWKQVRIDYYADFCFVIM